MQMNNTFNLEICKNFSKAYDDLIEHGKSLDNIEELKKFVENLNKELTTRNNIYWDFKKTLDEKIELEEKRKREEEKALEKQLEEEKDKKLREYWTENKLLECIKTINPNYCGISIRENCYKTEDFNEAVLNAFQHYIQSFNNFHTPYYNYINHFLQLLKTNGNQNLSFPEFLGTRFTLCYTKEKRSKLIEFLKPKEVPEGYVSL